jgi:hypothetical protein
MQNANQREGKMTEQQRDDHQLVDVHVRIGKDEQAKLWAVRVLKGTSISKFIRTAVQDSLGKMNL